MRWTSVLPGAKDQVSICSLRTQMFTIVGCRSLWSAVSCAPVGDVSSPFSCEALRITSHLHARSSHGKRERQRPLASPICISCVTGGTRIPNVWCLILLPSLAQLYLVQLSFGCGRGFKDQCKHANQNQGSGLSMLSIYLRSRGRDEAWRKAGTRMQRRVALS